MGEPTPNLLLKQWAATDEKIQTWTDYNSTLLTLDGEIATIKNNAQNVLWNGTAAYPTGATTLTPTKKLSECRNGWMLLWSDYDPGTGPNDYNFLVSYIPKSFAALFNGKEMYFPLIGGISDTTISSTGKIISVFDDKITGSDANGSSDNGSIDVCLRRIIEW